MHALQRQVLATWLATTETDTTLCRDHGLEVDAEAVAIESAFAVTAVRVLDLECFQKGGTAGYKAHRDDADDGQVVSAMNLIRNAEIHLPVILDPDVHRTVGVPMADGSQRFRVFPKWVPYIRLPQEIRDSVRTKDKPNATRAKAHQHYETALEGRFVVETLLDAVRFFHACDPTIVRHDDAGELDFFPLPEIAQHDYERRHPDWPTRAQYQADLRSRLESAPPAGDLRVITHVLFDDEDGVRALCGQTHSPLGNTTIFIETSQQVIRDIRAGYRYRVRLSHDETETEITEVDGAVGTASGALNLSALPPATEDERPWKDWHDLMVEDADYYGRFRRF